MSNPAALAEGEKILVVDDDARLRRLLERFLDEQGYRVRAVENTEQMDRLLSRELFQLVVLDLMLPGEDGLTACRRLREQNNQVPIIMLTAKGDEGSRIQGLELGADDYIVKPFDAKEVTARIKAVLRRSSKEEDSKGVYDFDNLHLDMNRYELKVKGKVVEAPPKELELLACLAGHPNRVYTRDQLLDEVWGFEYYGDSRTIDVHVKRLREKLEGASDKWNLKTVWGVGYKFEVRE